PGPVFHTIVSIKNDGHYFCRAGGNRPDGLNEPVTSVHDFIMLLPALLLVGWLVLVIILMFRDDKCDKTYREGSFPEFICLHSDRSSLRETDSERLIVKYTEIKSQK
ncbi:hypothetical protein ODQ96_22495, partial [Escherichia coli]|nr:hypothetical protein [Escherichia coli]